MLQNRSDNKTDVFIYFLLLVGTENFLGPMLGALVPRLNCDEGCGCCPKVKGADDEDEGAFVGGTAEPKLKFKG